MKRRFILTLLALAMLAGCVGCWEMEELHAQEGGFPELSFEVYVEVREQILVEYSKSYEWFYKVASKSDLAAILIAPFLEYHVASLSGYLDTPCAKRLARNAYYLYARRACDVLGIDFQSFNHAHEIYGREGLTYIEELYEYAELCPDYRYRYPPDIF